MSFGFFLRIWTFKGVGSSHWFMNQNLKNLVVPHIVPRGTANNVLLHKIRKKVQNRPTLMRMRIQRQKIDIKAENLINVHLD